MPTPPVYLPDKHRGVVDQLLPADLRRRARGLYSTSIPLAGLVPPNDPNHIANLWFSTSPNYRPLSITNPSVAALMFLDHEGIVRIVSSPTVETPPTMTPYVAGALGDSLGSFTPVKILLRDAIGHVTAFADGDFAAQHPAFAAPDSINNPVEADDHTYDFPDFPTYPDSTSPGTHLAKIPVVLPLPARHGVPSGLKIDDVTLADLIPLQTGHIGTTWLSAMRYLYGVNQGKSLLSTIQDPLIVNELRSTLPASLLPDLDTATVPISILESDNVVAVRLYESLRHIADRNFDNFVLTNPDLVAQMIPNLLETLQPPLPDANGNPPPGLATVETKARYTDGTLAHRLMLTIPPNETSRQGHEIPPNLSPMIAHVFRSDKMGIATQRIQKTLETFMTNSQQSSRSHLAHSVNFAVDLYTVAFATALLYANYHTGHLHQQSAFQKKTMISVTAFRPADMTETTASNVIAHTNQLLNEDQVQEAAHHASPISKSAIFHEGQCSTLGHLTTTVANHIAYFALLHTGTLQGIQENPTDQPAVVVILLELFDTITSNWFIEWFNANLPQAPYLVLSLENELQNVLRGLFRFATDPVNLSHLGDDKADQIDYGPLTVLSQQMTQLNTRLLDNVNMGSLGSYQAPPRQWTDALAAKKAAAAKKNRDRDRDRDDDHLSDRDAKRAALTQDRASDPTKGFLTTTGNANRLPPSPRISRNRTLLCFAYSIVGKSCPRGNKCKFLHISHPKLAVRDQADRDALDTWVQSTDDVEWNTGCGPLGRYTEPRNRNGNQ